MPQGNLNGLSSFLFVGQSSVGLTTTQITPQGQNIGCQICFVATGNVNTTPVWLKFWDCSTFSSGAPAYGQMIIPGNSGGAGSNITPGEAGPQSGGLQFTTGIAIGLSANPALTDQSGVNGSNVSVWVGYR